MIKNQKGITLIALVITIIILLILAGVSINTVVGDNGVITKAKTATYAQSVAVLEEYLNTAYASLDYKSIEEINENAENTTVGLMTVKKDWFYQPQSGLGYVIDSDGYIHYFINKEGLPNEIKNQLRGGEAGDGTYADYARLNDVYGVTSDLRAYYINGDMRVGAVENLEDDLTRVVFANGTAWADQVKANYPEVTGDAEGNITVGNLRKITALTINWNTEVGKKITSLSELYNFVSLREISLKNMTSSSLSGLENVTKLNYFYTYACTIGDYSALAKSNNLTYLYMEMGTNTEVEKLCNGIAGVNFSNLKYFGIYGYINAIYGLASTNTSSTRSTVTDISSLSKLSDITKNSIQYLYLNNNKIEDISVLQDFTNVYFLRIECNDNIKTLTPALNDMSNLTHLYANNNNLGVNEVYNVLATNSGKNVETDAISSLSNKSKLYCLHLFNNVNLKWIGYLENSSLLTSIRLINCTNMIDYEVSLIKKVYNNCSSIYKNIPDKYLALLNTDQRLDYSSLAISLTDTGTEITALKNNTDVQELSLKGHSSLSNSKLQEVLSTTTSMTTLQLYGLTNLTSIDFIASMPNLVELDLRGTNVTDLSILESLTNAGKLNLKSLIIDNESIDLTVIQNTISNLGKSSVGTSTFSGHEGNCGILITSSNLIQKLKNCTNITALRIVNPSSVINYASNTTVDLSNCLNLTYVNSYHCNIKWIISSSVTQLNIGWNSGYQIPDLSSAIALNFINLGESGISNGERINWFNEMAKAVNLQTIYMHNNGNLTTLEGIERLSYCTKLTRIDVYCSSNYIGNRNNLTSISGLGSITSLKEFYCYNQKITDISELATLTNLTTLSIYNNRIQDISVLSGLTNLTTLSINDNGVADLSPLTNLAKLTSLNLKNNAIYETYGSVNNMQILSNLINGGKLKTLYLSGNGINTYSLLDKSKLTAYDW